MLSLDTLEPYTLWDLAKLTMRAWKRREKQYLFCIIIKSHFRIVFHDNIKNEKNNFQTLIK